jgi:hypothetical protein
MGATHLPPRRAGLVAGGGLRLEQKTQLSFVILAIQISGGP